MKYLSGVTTLHLDADRCNGCGRCLEVCPRGVFHKQGKHISIIDRDLCIECGACAKNCAFGAIRVISGVGCASALLNGMIRGGEPSCDCGTSSKSCCG